MDGMVTAAGIGDEALNYKAQHDLCSSPYSTQMRQKLEPNQVSLSASLVSALDV